MDTFMDKLASRLNAQEMIRANSAAEAEETAKLKQEVDAYRECLQELKEICAANSDAKDEVSELVKVSIDKISAIQGENNTQEILRILQEEDRTQEILRTLQERDRTEEVLGAIKTGNVTVTSQVRTLNDELKNVLSEEMKKALNEELKQYISEELIPQVKQELKGQEESIHKECVKVYRNVQAVVTQENDKQTKSFETGFEKMRKKTTAALVCGILAMSFAALGLIVSVMDVLGVFSWIF